MFRWNRFIRVCHSSFHSITIERGPMPSAPGGLSAFFPNIKYDLNERKKKMERIMLWMMNCLVGLSVLSIKNCFSKHFHDKWYRKQFSFRSICNSILFEYKKTTHLFVFNFGHRHSKSFVGITSVIGVRRDALPRIPPDDFLNIVWTLIMNFVRGGSFVGLLVSLGVLRSIIFAIIAE